MTEWSPCSNLRARAGSEVDDHQRRLVTHAIGILADRLVGDDGDVVRHVERKSRCAGTPVTVDASRSMTLCSALVFGVPAHQLGMQRCRTGMRRISLVRSTSPSRGSRGCRWRLCGSPDPVQTENRSDRPGGATKLAVGVAAGLLQAGRIRRRRLSIGVQQCHLRRRRRLVERVVADDELPVGHLADAADARLLQLGKHLETRLAFCRNRRCCRHRQGAQALARPLWQFEIGEAWKSPVVVRSATMLAKIGSANNGGADKTVST